VSSRALAASYFRPQPCVPLQPVRGATVLGTLMRTVVIALASIVALASIAISTAPAYAQMRGKGGRHSGSEQQTAEQKQKAAEAEKAYKAALDRIPDKKKSDPWGNVR
jgi:hypothetical protein